MNVIVIFIILGVVLALAGAALGALAVLFEFLGSLIKELTSTFDNLVSKIKNSYCDLLMPPQGIILEIPEQLTDLLAKANALEGNYLFSCNNNYKATFSDFPAIPKLPIVPIFENLQLPPLGRINITASEHGVTNALSAHEVNSLHLSSKLDEIMLGKFKISLHKDSFDEFPDCPLFIPPPPPPTSPQLNSLLIGESEIPKPTLNLPLVQFDGFKGWLLNKHYENLCNSCYEKQIKDFIKTSDARDSLIALHKKRNEELKHDNELAEKNHELAKLKYDSLLRKYDGIKLDTKQQYDLRKQLYEKRIHEYCDDIDIQCANQNNFLENCRKNYGTFDNDGVESYFDLLLKRISLPKAIPREWKLGYSADNKILIVDYQFPYLPTLEILKLVELKSRNEWKQVNKTERKSLASIIHPALSIKLAYEIARHDNLNAVEAIVINGWLRYPDQATGNIKETYCSSILCQKNELLQLNLQSIDPIKSFQSFKGRSSGESFDVVPITPIISMDTQDSRFVDAKEVLSHLQQGENIATMDWESFEHLVRQLFEKLYAEHGAEVKITQASRDLGVDAVIFDPTPIKGGKTVIQAKRYVNVVDVSAVRDLFGTVHNEGANKGILVTTSYFGPESYEFAKDKPLELINGQQLLGLLEQFGYNKVRINLEEARVINKELMSRY